MSRLQVAVRVLRYLANQRGVRRAAFGFGTAVLASALVWRSCGSSPAPEAASPAESSAKVPAFCKRFDPSALYLWGEVVVGRTATRAISELSAPDVYCELPSRSTFLPSVRPDRRLMFMRDFGSDGERAYLYETTGDGELVPTPSCATRFSWLQYSDRHLHYGCKYWEIYEKEWRPIFYRDAAVVIGYGKGLESAFGEPSDGHIVAFARDGLSVVEMGTNTVKPITGLPCSPTLVRATRKGFLAMTEDSGESRLWQIAFDGTVTPDGVLAPLPPDATHRALAMTTDGEVFEYLPDPKDNTVVARTRGGLRTLYSDAEWKKRGRTFVRLDTTPRGGVALLTSR